MVPSLWKILLCFPSTIPYVVTNVITKALLDFVALRNNPSRSRMFPRHFINKYNFFPVWRQCLQIIFKRIEGIIPCLGFRLSSFRMTPDGPHEILNLHRSRSVVLADKGEIIFIVEELVYEICPADTPPSADDDKFGAVWFQTPLQFVTFSVSWNQSVLHNISVSANNTQSICICQISKNKFVLLLKYFIR